MVFPAAKKTALTEVRAGQGFPGPVPGMEAPLSEVPPLACVPIASARMPRWRSEGTNFRTSLGRMARWFVIHL